jgi:hypothetical protein
MALARLHEKLPTHIDAFELSQQGVPWALHLSNALEEIITAFCDDRMESTWGTLSVEQATHFLLNLRKAGWDYYSYLLNDRYADDEFNYLIEVVLAFNDMVSQQRNTSFGNTYSAVSMSGAVAVTLAEVLGTIIGNMFGPLNIMAATHESSREAINSYAEERLDIICEAIEQFLREQADLKMPQNRDTDGSIGESFVRLARAPLRQHMERPFRSLLEDLGFQSGHIVDRDSADTQVRLVLFLRHAARFFSYASPLLSMFFADRDEDSDDGYDENEAPPEHIANHDFASYHDDDWHWNELNIFSIEDELRGPENVALDDVSVIASAPRDESCVLCGGEHIEMRRIILCSHELCTDCLTKQLNTRHECRYKCAFCRRDFFPAMT